MTADIFEIQEELGEFLRQRREQKHHEEGRTLENELTWQELADRMPHVAATNLSRWKEGRNLPQNPVQIAELANEFGSEILVILGIIDEDLAVFRDNRNNPQAKRIVEEARQKIDQITEGKAYSPVR